MQELLKKYKTIYINRNIHIATIIVSVELMLLVVTTILFHMSNENDILLEYQDAVEIGKAVLIAVMVTFFIIAIFTNPAISPNNIEDILQRLSNGDIPAVKVQGSPQIFNFERKLVAGCAPVGGLVGFVKMAPVIKAGIMTSIYGNNGPSAVPCHELTTGVLVNLTRQQWEDAPTPDEVQLPYLRVTMFPETVGDKWCYLVPDAMGTDTARRVFGSICRSILSDIVEKRLQEAVLSGRVIRSMDDDGTDDGISFPFTENDLIPYFRKEMSEGGSGIYSDISNAEEMIQPLLKNQEKKISGHINYSVNDTME